MKTLNNKGFSLIEVMIVIAIMAIVSAIAIPNMIGWRAGHKLRGAVNSLHGDFQLARIKAIKEAEDVAIVFNLVTNSYTVFVDTDKDMNQDAGEQQIRNVILPVGVTIQASAFPNNRLWFDTRGMPEVEGAAPASSWTTTLLNDAGDTLRLTLNKVGKIRVNI